MVAREMYLVNADVDAVLERLDGDKTAVPVGP